MSKRNILLMLLVGLMLVLSGFVSGASNETPDTFGTQIMHYHFNESSGTTAVDSIGTNNLSGTGIDDPADWETRTDFGNVIDLDDAGEYFSDATFTSVGNGFMCFWMYPEACANGDDTVFHKDTGGSLYMQCIAGNWLADGPGTDYTYTMALNQWSHICIGIDGTNVYYYKNGTIVGSGAKGVWTDITGNGKFYIGANVAGGAGFNGKLDDWVIYSSNLSAYNVSTIYNASFGGGGTTAEIFTTTLISPANNTINNTAQTFYYNITSTNFSLLSNCSLWTNSTTTWHLNQTNTTAITTNGTYNFTNPIATDGTYIWNIDCQNGSTHNWATNNFTWIFDITNPIITPEPDLLNNNTIVWNGTLITYINFSDEREIYSVNVSFGNGTVIYNITNYGATNLQVNITENVSSTVSQNITARVCDAHTLNNIADIKRIEIDKEKKGLNYVIKDRWLWFQDDYIKVYPKTALEYNDPYTNRLSDRYTFIFNKIISPSTTQTFIIESNKFIDISKLQSYGGHLIIPDIGTNGYWVDFENDDATKYTIRRINDYKIEIDIDGLKNKVIEFDSIGELNCVNATYYFGNLNPVSDYEDIVLVNSNQSINLSTTQDTITMTTINATLYYNGTAYYAGAGINFSVNLTVPNIANSSVNVPFYWYVGIDGNYYNLSYLNDDQTIINFYLDNCTNYTMMTLNISYLDEGNSSSISLNIESSFNYSLYGIEKQYTLSQTLRNATQICMYPNFTSFNGSFDITYSSATYPQRRYIDEYVIYNNVTQQINLYGLYVDDGIYATFNIVDTIGNPLTDVLGTMMNVNTIMETEYSDGAGAMSFWEDPDITYTFTFVKSGCTTIQENLRITTSDVRTVTMDCGETTTYTANESYAAGIEYNFTPTGDLMNGTSYNFSYVMASSYWTITGCTFYLKNYSGFTLSSVGGTYTATNCNATIQYNTANLTSIMSQAIYSLNSSGDIIRERVYTIYYTYDGDFSLRNFLDDLEDFTDAGFNTFSRMLLAFIVIFIITAMITYKLDIIDPEAIVIIIVMLTWFFSYIGWLTLNYAEIDSGVIGFVFIRKYILAILITMMGAAYIIKRQTD